MDTNKKEYYIGRELSLLAFNERVLSEAQDIHNPLMEKLKFTAIFSSNMDEFFMVRVAGLIEQISAGYKKTDIAGYTPEEQLVAVSKETRRLIEKQQSIFRELAGELEKYNVLFNPVLNNEYYEDTEDIFIDAVMSVVSPVTLDPAHPFPFIYNKRMSLIAALEKQGKEYFSLIMLPENIRRYFVVHKGGKKIIWTVEEVIKRHIQKLFRGYNVKTVNVFRVTRNTDIDMRSEEVADIILSMKDFLSRRIKGAVTRVEIEADTPAYIVEFLQKMVNFKDMDTQYIQGVIDLTFLFSLSSLMPNMQFPVHKRFSVPDLPENSEIFSRIKEKDIFFFRPYYAFSTVSKLIAIAAEDNDVLAIKMTLYRTNRDSSILASLLKAAKSGKQVSVVVELKARFDEERNIDWSKNLEDAGCIVTYGIAGLKIHAKCLLIVRREQERIKRYTHIATGNYNENTASLYTDVDLITSDDCIGRDAAQLFNYLMAYTEEQSWKALSVAPFNLRENLYKLFDNEIRQAKEGRKAHIIMKMNSLIDKEMIDKMYEASNAGVRIDLIVRGICGLKAGCKGFSSNIKVRSIVGRLLEHSRIFYFENAGNPRYFIASADMMPRNLNRRVELMAEINDEDFKNALGKFLDVTLKDNMKAWQLTGDTFTKVVKSDDEEAVNSQEYFMNNRLI